MKRLLVLLRAVNVGGTAKLPMDAFARSLTDAGFLNVKTYIASGNVIFDTEAGEEDVRLHVNSILNSQFNISGERSIVRDGAALNRTIKTNPFQEAARQRPNMLHVHFLSAPPLAHAETNLTSYKGAERLRLEGQQLFIDYGNSVSQSALTGRFLETALGCSGTSRNWNTVLKLVEFFNEA